MAKTRTEYIKKNIFYGYINTITISVLQIICRTIFVYTLGASYLGVAGLFTNVLGVLSFTELGIGSAIIFSLYKPITEKDNEKIKSLLLLYKKAYRIIAAIITIIGLIIVPFLDYLVKTEIPIKEIRMYYCIFLFNTVSSYFITYKTSYVTALQKDYIISNITTIGRVVIITSQIILLICGGDYFGYLIIAAIIGLFQKLGTIFYLNKKFPILKENNAKKLDKNIKYNIWKNVKALIIHKIGDVSVNQTDNIIISAFINTQTVGVVSNYVTLSTMVSLFTTKFFGSFTASFGNMLVKDDIKKQIYIFEVYDLLGFWIYGFVYISFITLSQSFIVLWLGENLLLDDITMFLFFTSVYLSDISYIPYNYKIAAGKFNEDKWVAFIQAIINLIVSVIAIKMIGLPGIFIGTVASRMIVVIVRPYIVYKYILKDRVIKYYIRLIKRTLLAFLICILMSIIKEYILFEITIGRFIIMCFLTLIIPNIIFFFIFRKRKEFSELIIRIKRRI